MTYTLSAESIAKLRELIEDYYQTVPASPTRPSRKGGRPTVFRIGRTGAHTESYPSTGNVFECELGEYVFDPALGPGQVTDTFTPYNPQIVVNALTLDSQYIESGEIVGLVLSHGKWYIFRSGGGTSDVGLYRYELTQGWSLGSTQGAIINNADNTPHTNGGIEDPFRLMSDQSAGDVGWCILMNGTYWAIQAPCDTSAGGGVSGIPYIPTGIIQASTF